MKLQIITACYQPYSEYEHQYQYLIKSAQKHSLNVIPYGLNAPFYPGWVEIKLLGQLRYLEGLTRDITHILYTDGRDTFFRKTENEILTQYKYNNSPALFMSCSNYPQWGEINPENYKENYYPHSGGYIGTVRTVKRYLKQCLKYSEFGDDSHCLQKVWEERLIRITRDRKNKIFQVVQNGEEVKKSLYSTFSRWLFRF